MSLAEGPHTSSPETNPESSSGETRRSGRRGRKALSADRPRKVRVGTDGRHLPFCVVTHNLIDFYGPKLRATGLGVYLGLVRFMAQGDRSCFPSYSTLAQRVGITRRTAISWVKRLVRLGLVVVERCASPKGGDVSNTFRLIEPPAPDGNNLDLPGGENLQETPGGGVKTLHPPGENFAPPGCKSDTPHQEQDPGNKNQGSVCVRTHTPDSSFPEEVKRLVALWLDLLAVRTPTTRDTHAIEARAFISELLRQGWPFDRLAVAIRDPDRNRAEWPRKWFDRLVAKGRPAARRDQGAAAANVTRQAAREEAAAAARSLETPEGKAALDELRRRAGRGKP